MSMALEIQKSKKKTMIVQHITRIIGFIRNPIRKDNNGRLATIPNFREYARLRKWMLHLFYRTVHKNPYSLEKGSKKLLLAVSGNR
jgi:hypothetical protein